MEDSGWDDPFGPGCLLAFLVLVLLTAIIVAFFFLRGWM